VAPVADDPLVNHLVDPRVTTKLLEVAKVGKVGEAVTHLVAAHGRSLPHPSEPGPPVRDFRRRKAPNRLLTTRVGCDRALKRREDVMTDKPDRKPGKELTPYRAQQLEARAAERIVVPARLAGRTLPVLGLTDRPREPELAHVRGTPWLFTDAFADPLAADVGGRLVLPGPQREQLVRLVQAGVAPDLVWIAHELPKGTTEKDVDKLRIPPPKRLVERERKLLDGLRRTARGAAVTAGTVAAAPFALLAGMDPVLLGGAVLPDLDAVCWVELVRWDW
jgi:hypothetical protein